jgi:hypothetical protein
VFGFGGGVTCTRIDNTILITDAFSTSLGAGKVVTVLIKEVTNPPSSTETASIKVYSLTEDGGIIDSFTDGMTVTAEPGLLNSVGISQMSGEGNDIIGKNSVWEFTITPEHPVDTDGQVQITFPLWNGHLSAPSSSEIHYTISTPDVCNGTSGDATTDSSAICTYTPLTRILTVKGIIGALTSAEFSFKVGPIRNPANGEDTRGFVVSIADNHGGIVD